MRFSTSVLALLTLSSSALALSTPFRLLKRADQTDPTELLKVSDNCEAYLDKLTDKYSECLIGVSTSTKAKLSNLCQMYSTDKCQKYYQIKLSEVPECKDSNASSLVIADQLKQINNLSAKLICLADENKNRCAYGSIIIENADKIINMTDKDEKKLIEKIKKETCKSKKCTSDFVQVHNEMTDTLKKFADVSNLLTDENISEIDKDIETNEILNFFKSEECAAQAKPTDQTKPTAQDKSTNTKSKSKPRKCIVVKKDF